MFSTKLNFSMETVTFYDGNEEILWKEYLCQYDPPADDAVVCLFLQTAHAQ